MSEMTSAARRCIACKAFFDPKPVYVGTAGPFCSVCARAIDPGILFSSAPTGAQESVRNPRPDPRFGPQTPDAPLIDVSKAFVNQRTVTYDELAKFHEVAEVALCAAKAHPEDYRDEPINWADLSVVDAGVTLSNIDAESATIRQCWYVEIDEASPGGCPKFAAAVRKEIMAAGYDPVSVMTEW